MDTAAEVAWVLNENWSIGLVLGEEIWGRLKSQTKDEINRLTPNDMDWLIKSIPQGHVRSGLVCPFSRG